MMVVWCVAFVWTLLAFGGLERLRREDVVYVDDYLKKPVALKTLRATSITFSRDGNGFLDTLRPTQEVRLIGIAEDRFLVEARITNGRAEGWVLPGDMEPIPEAVIKEIQKKSDEAEKEKKAIARGQVEVGMSQEAVQKILGKPKGKSSILENEGSFEQWKYPSYKTVPVYVPTVVNGTNVVYSFYQKVLVGEKVVTFQDKKVIRYETKDEAPPNAGGQTVIPPIVVQ
jgi:hypothetical protein